MRARGRLEARADQWAVESSSTAPPHGVGLVEMKSACFSLPERLPSSAFGTNLPSEIVRPSDARCSASIFDERHLTKAAEPGVFFASQAFFEISRGLVSLTAPEAERAIGESACSRFHALAGPKGV